MTPGTGDRRGSGTPSGVTRAPTQQSRCAVHAAGGVYSWPKPEPEIVCCHALAISATGNIDQRTQTGVSDAGQILQSNGNNGAVFSD